MGRHAPEIGFSRSGRGCFADLESPSPQARLNQHKGKFYAVAYRDLSGNGAPLQVETGGASRRA